MLLLKSMILFIAAGLCEIGGGYLIWLWLREGKAIWFALAGAIILILYGIVPTFQPAHFGRVYAAYGGIFVVLSIFWGVENRPYPAGSFRSGRRADLPDRRLYNHVLAQGKHFGWIEERHLTSKVLK